MAKFTTLRIERATNGFVLTVEYQDPSSKDRFDTINESVVCLSLKDAFDHIIKIEQKEEVKA